MTLIADSGSTKTDWCYGNNTNNYRILQTSGINPFHQAKENIETIFSKELMPQLPNLSQQCNRIYFYGAGCLPQKVQSLKDVMTHFFPYAEIYIGTDLLGASRAACNNTSGIVCIMGTGSNSCVYDGIQIRKNIPPLGYILGDEGSGAYIGKRFLSDCLKGLLSNDLQKDFLKYLGMTYVQIIEQVYQRPQANRFLSSFIPYIHQHKDIPQIHKLLLDCFYAFFCRNVIPYHESLPVSFVGSIAWYFKDEIVQSAQSLHLSVARIIKNPIQGLINYHFSDNKNENH